MADKKISALTASTTPLAGTEVLPIVQSGSTVKVSVSSLTTGRAVTGLSFTALASGTADAIVGVQNSTGLTSITQGGDGNTYILNFAAKDLIFGTNGSETVRFANATKDIQVKSGSVTISAAGKGINLKSPDGLTTKLLRLSNLGALELI